MVFTSIYTVVDGYFVSNYVGKTPFAALNLVWPFLMICGALGFMIGSGGSALVSKTMGEGDDARAKRLFSMLVGVTVLIGAALTAVVFIFMRPISMLLGAEGEMLDDCVTYGRILTLSMVPFMLQNEFQSFLIAAERPRLGLAVTVAAGVTNMVLDALFVAVLGRGLAGAAAATALSQTVGGVIPLIYFLSPNHSRLRLCRAEFDGRAFLRVCFNGASEFVSNISMSVVGILFNLELLRIAGEDGVAAYGVVMYIDFVLVSVLLGYSIGTAPVISFHFGAENHDELRSLYRKSLTVIAVVSVVVTVFAELSAGLLTRIFISGDPALFEMTRRGIRLYSMLFLLAGFNMFGSSFFTALNDGFVSAVISFLRLFVFQILSLYLLSRLLPEAIQLDGIWLAPVAAEVLSLSVTAAFLIGKRGKYHYAG